MYSTFDLPIYSQGQSVNAPLTTLPAQYHRFSIVRFFAVSVPAYITGLSAQTPLFIFFIATNYITTNRAFHMRFAKIKVSNINYSGPCIEWYLE